MNEADIIDELLAPRGGVADTPDRTAVAHGNTGRVNNPSGRPKKTAEQHAADRAALEAASAEYAASAAPLFNDSPIELDDPRVSLKHEQPHHRLMISLRARGYAIREIADMTRRTPAAVSLVLKQPWARIRMMELMQQDDSRIADILKAEALPSIEKLVEIRDDEKSPVREARAAAEKLLEHFIGKPTQRIETAEAQMPTDIEKLTREAEALRKEAECLIGSSN